MMNYVSIQDRQKEFKFDLNTEYIKLYNYILDSNNKCAYFINTYFSSFYLKNYTTSYGEFMQQEFHSYLNKFGQNDHLNKYLFTSEFFLNLEFFITKHNYYTTNETAIKDKMILLSKRVLKILSLIGYTSIEIELDSGDVVINVMKMDPHAEIIASQMEDNKLKFDILRFNHFSISPKDKQVIVENMYKYFEGIRSSSVESVANTIANIMNNGLRHSSDSKIKNKAISEFVESDDNILDQVYNLLIECFYHEKNLSIIKKIKSLSNNGS